MAGSDSGGAHELGALAMNAPLSKKTVRIIVQLNDRWRAIEAPPRWYPQWILQRKKGSASARNDGWVGRAYCTTHKALIRNIQEHCGEVDLDRLSMIVALPETMTRTEFRASRADKPIGTIVLAGCTPERTGAHIQTGP